MRSRLALMILSLLVLLIGPAHASPGAFGESNSRIEITPFAGWRFGGRFQTDVGDMIFKSEPAVGASIGFRTSPDMLIEFIYSRQATSLEMEKAAFQSDDWLMDMTVHYAQAGFNYENGLGRLRPFVSGGLGLVVYSPDSQTLRAERRFAFNLGTGLRLLVTPHVGLKLQGRGWFASAGQLGQRIFCETTDFCPVDEQGNLVSQGEASGGLFIRF